VYFKTKLALFIIHNTHARNNDDFIFSNYKVLGLIKRGCGEFNATLLLPLQVFIRYTFIEIGSISNTIYIIISIRLYTCDLSESLAAHSLQTLSVHRRYCLFITYTAVCTSIMSLCFSQSRL